CPHWRHDPGPSGPSPYPMYCPRPGRAWLAPPAAPQETESDLFGNSEDDLAELLAGLEPRVGGGGLRERKDRVDHRPRPAARDQLVDGLEVLPRPHRRAVHRELLPPDPVPV